MARRRRVLVAVLLLLSLPACSTWQVGTPTPAEFVQREHPQTVRVTRTDGRQVVMARPRVQADTLIGQMGAGDTTRLFLLLSEVRSVEVWKYSGRKTALVTGGVLGALTVIWVIDCQGRSGLDAIGCP